jgi:protein-disulfide isomerase
VQYIYISIMVFVAGFSLSSSDGGLADGGLADGGSPVLADIQRIYPGEITTGVHNAPVTLIAYINYECTYCAAFEKEVLPTLSKFVDQGQLNLVYRIFPMSNDLNSDAFLKSELAVCSAQTGRFPDTSNILFNNQHEVFWKHYEKWAGVSGVEAAEGIKACVDFHKTRHTVITAQQRYAHHGVRVTPTIFINGHKMEGLHPYEGYEEVIKQLLEE